MSDVYTCYQHSDNEVTISLEHFVKMSKLSLTIMNIHFVQDHFKQPFQKVIQSFFNAYHIMYLKIFVVGSFFFVMNNRIPDEKQLISVTEKLACELEEQSKQLDELRESVCQVLCTVFLPVMTFNTGNLLYMYASQT